MSWPDTEGSKPSQPVRVGPTGRATGSTRGTADHQGKSRTGGATAGRKEWCDYRFEVALSIHQTQRQPTTTLEAVEDQDES